MNLYIRGTDLDPTCPLCGEKEETVDHLITFCAVSREIWSHLVPEAFSTRHLSTVDFVNFLWKSETKNASPLSAFIGWNIWKARNNLIFNNEPVIIPHILQKASEDHYLWITTTTPIPRQEPQSPRNQIYPHPSHSTDPPTHKCFVDASWVSPSSHIGISWNLYSRGRPYLKGSGSFPPTATTSDAEALAILEACKQITRFGEPGVAIYSDAKNHIDNITTCINLFPYPTHEDPSKEYVPYNTNPIIEDIYRLALSKTPQLTFCYLPRRENCEAHAITKKLEFSMYLIKLPGSKYNTCCINFIPHQ